MFKEALEKSICLATIKNEFIKTGLYPYDPDVIDKSCLIPTLPQQQQLSLQKKKTSTVSAPINVILGNITPQDPAKVNEINDTSTTLQSTLDDFAESPVFPFKKDPIKNSANLQNSTNQLSILPGTSSFVVLTTISNSTTGTSSTIKSTSAFDFNLNLSYEQNTPRIMENILVEANKIPYHLGDIFYQPPAAKQQKKKNSQNCN